MGNVYLLDCTLRDGGYLNDWAFGQNSISSIFERLVSANIDVIEVGFLDERRSFDLNRTIMPNTESVGKIFGELSVGSSMVVGMIDYGTCGIENIQPCEQSWLDGIRVIFKKEKMYPAVAFCRQIKALGYKVFIQAVSITSYSDDELRELVSLVNDCHPYAMSMVDTYGLCDEATLAHIIDVIDACLDQNITLGYHAHNNFQLGYSNAMSVLNKGLKRDVLVDGTLYGMGKSAGNAPLELLAMYMNVHYGKHYGVTQIQEAISTSILDLFHKRPWGYTLFYYIAASNQCHPDYVSHLMNKCTLSITSVNEILRQIPKEQKLDKNMALIERLYLEYQAKVCDDRKAISKLRGELSGKKVLMLGPGKSMQEEKDKILAYIDREKPVTVAINYIPEDLSINYLFLTNTKRYLQMSSRLLRQKSLRTQIIATSNVTPTEGEFSFVVNYGSLIDQNAEIVDNSMVMLLKLLKDVGVSHVALAGFDGYTPDSFNYFDVNMEYSFVKSKADMLNKYGREFLKAFGMDIALTFVTDSQYV